MDEYNFNENNDTNLGNNRNEYYNEDAKIKILKSQLNEDAPLVTKVIIILIGIIGFNLLGTVVGTILAIAFGLNDEAYLATLSYSEYSSSLSLFNSLTQFLATFLTFIAIILVISFYKKGKLLFIILRGFKKKSTYVWGLLFLGLGFAIETILGIGISFIQNQIEYNVQNQNEVAVRELITGNYSVLNFFSIVILAPLTEELTYRFGFLDSTGHKKRVLGLMLSSFFFAFAHFQGFSILLEGIITAMQNPEVYDAHLVGLAFLNELLHFPIYFGMGVSLGLGYLVTGNISTSVITHMLNNFLSFMSVLLL